MENRFSVFRRGDQCYLDYKGFFLGMYVLKEFYYSYEGNYKRNFVGGILNVTLVFLLLTTRMGILGNFLRKGPLPIVVTFPSYPLDTSLDT